jgi:hypothetical protein
MNSVINSVDGSNISSTSNTSTNPPNTTSTITTQHSQNMSLGSTPAPHPDNISYGPFPPHCYPSTGKNSNNKSSQGSTIALINANNIKLSPNMHQKLSASSAGHTRHTLTTSRTVEQRPPSRSAGRLATVARGKRSEFQMSQR